MMSTDLETTAATTTRRGNRFRVDQDVKRRRIGICKRRNRVVADVGNVFEGGVVGSSEKSIVHTRAHPRFGLDPRCICRVLEPHNSEYFCLASALVHLDN